MSRSPLPPETRLWSAFSWLLPGPPCERSAASVLLDIVLAGMPNIVEFTPKALAAFTGLLPQEHGSGTSMRKPGKMSRVGAERLRSTLYMCALSAKRTNTALAAFVSRMTAAGKPPKVILVARKLLVYAHAVVRTQKPFDPFPNAPSRT